MLTCIQGPVLPLLHPHRVRPCHPPLSYTLLRPDKGQNPLLFTIPSPERRIADEGTDIEDTAPRIKSDFKPIDDALVQGQKRKQRRRERRLKRIITVAAGWLTMGLMIYLISVTKTTAPKIWDPYTILEISRVKGIRRRFFVYADRI